MLPQVVEQTDSLLFHRATGADLLVLFSGWNAGFVDPKRFHFIGSTGSLELNKLYLRDYFGVWYHCGLAGHTDSISGTAQFLADFFSHHRFRRVRMLGVSSGGYAALLFGALLGVEAIFALSPRTFLDPVNRQRTGDNRLQGGFDRLYRSPSAEPAFFDLATVLRRHPPSRPAEVHYDPEGPIDRAHAEHLKACPSVRLFRHPGTGHALQVMSDPRFLARVLA